MERTELNWFWMTGLFSFILIPVVSHCIKIFWSTWKASLKMLNFSLPKLLSVWCVPEWKINSVFSKRWLWMARHCWGWLTLSGAQSWWGTMWGMSSGLLEQLWLEETLCVCSHTTRRGKEVRIHLCATCAVRVCSPDRSCSTHPASEAVA